MAALAAFPATAQTPMGGQGRPLGTAPNLPAPPAPLPPVGANPGMGVSVPSVAAPQVPVPPGTVKQAEQHGRGEFGTMKRSAIGGQIQEAWDASPDSAGVVKFVYCAECTYKVRLREHMVTTIELPAGEVFEKADIGDPDVFKVEPRGQRRLAINSVGFGADTSLIVYGKGGAVYPFYLRLESYNSKNVPDLLVRIEGRPGTPDAARMTGFKTIEGEKEEGVALPDMGKEVAKLTPKTPPVEDKPAGDFVKNVPFDPNSLRGWGQYKLWGGGNYAEDLKPETVFRDDYFTYVKFGRKWKDIELPTPYVVVDGIDELVNSRVVGETYIIESVQRLITLKSGETYICIEYVGDKT